MKAEPLKNKTIRFGQKDKPITDFKSNLFAHFDSDIKSAVEWLREKLWDRLGLSIQKDDYEDIIDQAFPDLYPKK